MGGNKFAWGKEICAKTGYHSISVLILGDRGPILQDKASYSNRIRPYPRVTSLLNTASDHGDVKDNVILAAHRVLAQLGTPKQVYRRSLVGDCGGDLGESWGLLPPMRRVV